MSLKFNNRVALITGGSTGIGAATAVELAHNGVKLVINYFRSRSEAEKVAAMVKSLGCDALVLQADVRSGPQVGKMIDKAIDHFGRIDILVNNAGGLIKRVPVAEMQDTLLEETLDLNVRTVFNCSKAVMSHMIKQEYGRIVNVSSVAAFNGGGRGASVYAAAKAWVDGFTRALAKEVSSHSVTVNSVAPGLIDTPFHVKAETGSFEPFMPFIPLKRVGTADEVASLITFLASDNSSYVTGSVFHVNGGQYLG
jgi:3-oxoacyl-[acyl-carrier protein] reductase